MNPWQDLRVLRRSDHTFLRHSRLAGKPKMGHLQQASSFTKGSHVPHVRQASLTLAKKAVQPTPFTEKKNKARRSSFPRLRSSNWTVTEPRLRTQAFRAPNPAPLPPGPRPAPRARTRERASTVGQSLDKFRAGHGSDPPWLGVCKPCVCPMKETLCTRFRDGLGPAGVIDACCEPCRSLSRINVSGHEGQGRSL